MATGEENPEHRWRLDVDAPGGVQAYTPRATFEESAPSRDASHARLARAVYVVTVEHVCWAAIGAWALITRLVALGAAPMNPAGAVAALAEFAIAKGGRAALAATPGHYASWPELLQGAVFAAVGAGDARARVVVAICGLIMVKLAFATRRCVGRAGALALGAMLAMSPTLTYYSRGGVTAVASMTFMLLAILVAESMRSRPGAVRCAALGAAIALWLSADPIGYPTAIAAVTSLVVVSLLNATIADHRRLRARVWWERRRAVVVVTAVVAIVGLFALTTMWFSYPVAEVIVANVRAAFWRTEAGRGIFVLTPIVIAYEFGILVFACIGVVAAFRQRTGFSRWLLVWSLVNTGEVLFTANRPDWVVALLIGFALVGAVGFEWMFHSTRWNLLRYPIAALAALTIWVQLTTSFVFSAPNTNEAAWDRHALLYWDTQTTSIRTRNEFRRAVAAVAGTGATVSIPDDAPQARWYLREFAAAESPATASIVVTLGSTQAGSAAGNTEAGSFGFEEWWRPDYRRLTIGSAIRYFFTQRAWSDVQIRDARIEVRDASAHAVAE